LRARDRARAKPALKLYPKTLLGISLPVLVLVAALFGVWRATLLDSYRRFEIRDTQRDVERALDILRDRVAKMQGHLRDWAAWTPSYEFMENRNQAYLDDNISGGLTLQDLGIHWMAYVSPSGELVFSRAIHEVGGVPTVVELARGILPQLALGRPLVSHRDVTDQVMGFVLLPEGIGAVVSQPILTTSHQGPIRGSLVWGRFITHEDVGRMAELAHLSIALERVDDRDLPADMKDAIAELAPQAPVDGRRGLRVHQLGQSKVAGYTLIDDLDGKPALVLRVDSSRALFEQGIGTVRQSLVWLLIGGGILGLVVAATMRWLVLAPITRLSGDLKAIGGGGDSSRRLAVRGADEIAELGQSVNQMLVDLERSQTQILERDRYFRALIDQTTDVIVLLDVNATFRYANQAVRWVLGYEPAELVGRRAFDFLHPDDKKVVFDVFANGVAPGATAAREFRFRHKDGSWRYIEASGRLLLDDPAVNGVIAAARDITPRRQAEEELRQARAAAEAANRSKSAFLANMSHELRTPLNSIIGFSELLQEQTFGPLSSKQLRYVTNVLSSGRHLLQLINDILDLSKIEAGHMKLDLGAVDVPRVLEDVRGIVNALATQKSIQIDLDTDPALPLVMADSAKFRQILYNLLSNAIKFTPDQGTVRIVARPAANAAGDPAPSAAQASHLQISVIDSGIGIRPEDRNRLFREFEQLDAGYARQQQGTGLGLALTKRLVEMHEGTIWFDSAGEGCGTTFTFTLPVSGPGATLTPRPAPRRPDEPRTAELVSPRAPLLLVVEDDLTSAALLKECFTLGGYRVIHAGDGATALRLAREKHPQAITLDVMLPGMDGWSVLQELKASPETASIPVIIVSSTEDRQLGFTLGATDFLVKPTDPQRIVNTVRHALDGAVAKPRVLVIDDDSKLRSLLTDLLSMSGFEVLSAPDGAGGIDLALARHPDVVVLDLMMPGLSGFDVVTRLRDRAESRDLPIVVYTVKDLAAEERTRLVTRVQAIATKGRPTDLVQVLRRLLSGTPPKP